jgi:hypothetical protein
VRARSRASSPPEAPPAKRAAPASSVLDWERSWGAPSQRASLPRETNGTTASLEGDAGAARPRRAPSLGRDWEGGSAAASGAGGAGGAGDPPPLALSLPEST